MSTEYFYIKESTKELFDLGNGGHYYDLYELILKKIRSFQKSGTSIDVVKEKLKPYILEEFQYFDSDITEDDSYLCFFVERVIPALLNWIDDTTNLINDYELVVSVEKEFGKEFCENFYEENHNSYVDQVYKTVGSIYEDETNFYFRSISQVDFKLPSVTSVMKFTLPPKLKEWYANLKKAINE